MQNFPVTVSALDLQRAVGSFKAVPRAMTCVITIMQPGVTAEVFANSAGEARPETATLTCKNYDCSTSATVRLSPAGDFDLSLATLPFGPLTKLKIDVSTSPPPLFSVMPPICSPMAAAGLYYDANRGDGLLWNVRSRPIRLNMQERVRFACVETYREV